MLLINIPFVCYWYYFTVIMTKQPIEFITSPCIVLTRSSVALNAVRVPPVEPSSPGTRRPAITCRDWLWKVAVGARYVTHSARYRIPATAKWPQRLGLIRLGKIYLKLLTKLAISSQWFNASRYFRRFNILAQCLHIGRAWASEWVRKCVSVSKRESEWGGEQTSAEFKGGTDMKFDTNFILVAVAAEDILVWGEDESL